MDFGLPKTFIGGKRRNLEIEDLKPLELIEASCGSMVRASELLRVARAQIAAAEDLGDLESAHDFTNAKLVLAQIARLDTRG